MTDATALEDLIKAYDVRGVVPEPFSAEVARAIGAAFAEVVVTPSGGRTAVIGRDMRSSGPALVEAFADGLTARGVDVVLIGLCSTDGLYHASGALRFPGAMFTASHNPAQYNGIKMCHAGARPVGQDTGLEDIRRLAGRFLREGLPTAADQPGTVTEREMLPEYAVFLRSLVDLSGIRPLKVVVDAGNGMAGLTAPAVLGAAVGLPALPLDVVDLYFELDGSFPNHEANPLDPKNLVDLQAAVVANGADIGLAFDGDADRCFVIDERGEPVSPSAITALVGLREVAREVAAGRRPTVIHNLITSRVVPDLLQAAGARTVRTRVGHSYIKAEMAEQDAVFGGEHSAHYYFRDFFFADAGMHRCDARAGRARQRALRRRGAGHAERARGVLRAVRRERGDQLPGRRRPRGPGPGRGGVRHRAGRRTGRGRRARRPDHLALGRPAPLVVQPAGLQHRAAAAAQRRGGRRGRDDQGA